MGNGSRLANNMLKRIITSNTTLAMQEQEQIYPVGAAVFIFSHQTKRYIPTIITRYHGDGKISTQAKNRVKRQDISYIVPTALPALELATSSEGTDEGITTNRPNRNRAEAHSSQN